MNLPGSPFSFPSALPLNERLQFCLRVIGQYREELPRLRAATTILKRQKKKAEDEIGYWKQKYQEERGHKEHLEKENDRLKREIEKLTKTTNRYRASLFDHGNFKAPVTEERKSKGGQPGHADTNREHRDDAASFVKTRLFLAVCPWCRKPVGRVNGTQQKQLIDIILNPQVVKLIVESERQWCPTCRKEVSATDERSLPFTEYGINTFMMAMLLRYRCLLSLSKISLVFAVGYGLSISESGLLAVFTQAKQYLAARYDELKAIVRKGEILYTDETGWHVRGEGAWMWIMASNEATVYVAAESRGKGVAREIYGTSQAYAMHDGYASYATTIPPDKQLYCWAHILRFAYEETGEKPNGHENIHIRDALVDIYHLKHAERYQSHPEQLETEASERIDRLIAITSEDSIVTAILRRLRDQRDGLIRALVVTPNGTNNFAEQELRPMALARRISYGSDTYAGMETTAILSSVVQTFMRTKRDEFFPLLQASLRDGFAKP